APPGSRRDTASPGRPGSRRSGRPPADHTGAVAVLAGHDDLELGAVDHRGDDLQRLLCGVDEADGLACVGCAVTVRVLAAAALDAAHPWSPLLRAMICRHLRSMSSARPV